MPRNRVKSVAGPVKRSDSRPAFEPTKRSDVPKAFPPVPTEHASKPSAQSIAHMQKPEPVLGYSRETLDSRLELLHLHAVHLPSHETQRQWKAHAYASYQKRFEELQKKSLDLDEKEMEALEQRNAAAILSWTDQENGISIEHQAQKASSIVDQVWRMSAPNGKYALAIQAFEHWLEAADRVQRQRTSRRNAGSRINVVEGLGDGWKAEIRALQSIVLNAADEIISLGEMSPGGSDLERCITAISEMLKNMLEELDLIVSIEEHMVADEKDWVEGSINQIASGLKSGLSLG